MSISEFKNKINLIIGFVARVNEANIPVNIMKPMVKAYASTLRINLSDRMVESLLISIPPEELINTYAI